MSEGRISVVCAPPFAKIVLDRPGKRNAMSLSMWRAVPTAIAEVSNRRDVEAILIEGAGEAFSAGADISELEEMVANRQAGVCAIDAISAAEGAIAASSKPTIALIKGACVGGGLELAMACDLRFATTGSSFMAPPARLGIAYSVASTRRLVALVGESRAAEMLFSPREMSAAEALAAGLVNAVYEQDQFAEATAKFLHGMLKHSLFSIMSAKQIIRAVRQGHSTDTADIRELRVRGFSEADFAEGVAAFRERRKARFSWGVVSRGVV